MRGAEQYRVILNPDSRIFEGSACPVDHVAVNDMYIHAHIHSLTNIYLRFAIMWEKYSGKHILITGGSGFLGTALVHRIITKAPTVGRIYIICRNGRL